MAYAFVHQDNGSGGGASGNCALATGLTVTSGNFIWIVASYFHASAQTVTWPSAWGAITEVGSFHNASDGAGARWGYRLNATAGSSNANTIFSATVDFPALYVAEYSGIATSSALVASPSLVRQVNPGTGAGAITISASPTLQPALVLGFSFCIGASVNWDTAVNGTGRTRVWEYTSGTSFAGKPQDKRVTATGSTAMTWTTSAGTDTYYTIAAAFAEPGATGGGTPVAPLAQGQYRRRRG